MINTKLLISEGTECCLGWTVVGILKILRTKMASKQLRHIAKDGR